jgi:polysaccharide export outer membrane protein
VKAQFPAQAAFAAVIAFGSLTADGQTSDGPHAPENHVAPGVARDGVAADGVAAAVDPNRYLIGPEDILFIKVWREPDFTLPVAVRPDGKITIPLIGEVQAGQETPGQLTKNLAELLAKYINNAEVTVFVTEVRSKKFYLDGELNRPGSFPLVTPTRVLEALSRGGGFKDFANTKKIRILRDGKVYYFNYKEVTSGKRLDQNILLENGDHIIVR